MSARPYVRMEQLGTQWSFFITFDIGKSVDKIQVLLKSDKNNGIFKWKSVDIFYHISLSCS